MANNLDDIVTVATSTLATITPQSHRVDVILRIIELWYNDIMEEDWLEYYERQLTLGQELTDTKIRNIHLIRLWYLQFQVVNNSKFP